MEFVYVEVVFQCFVGYYCLDMFEFGMFFYCFVVDFGDLLFEVVYFGFVGVVVNDVVQGVFFEGQFVFFQVVGLDLFWNQVFGGDIDFFVFGVVWQVDDFYLIQQGCWDVY